ncbi:MAG: PD-(D/E)XK nuclease family protein [Christensenellaceae bacterium]
MENNEISALEQAKFDALQEFLLDIECLDSLTEWTKRFNLFDILKITRTEIRHSNMLAWLLNPNENHGLGDRVLRGLIRQTVLFFDAGRYFGYIANGLL